MYLFNESISNACYGTGFILRVVSSECLDTAPPPAAAAGTPLEVLPGFDAEAGTSWVYPVNYPVRQYQYNIVHTAIFENTLVSLPTGKI